MARRRRDRGPTIDGVLVVDKPAGMTSHDVVDAVRRASGMSRVGHTGTLDPAATGVLVLCLGQATRIVRLLQGGPKTYEATVRFGATTTTQDAEGDVVVEADASHLDRTAVEAAFAGLVGDIEQVPPMVSAVRVDGERLYEKARRGEEVERAPRPVTVHAITVDDVRTGPQAEADVTVVCGPGTYVRTLAHDAGDVLGVGAHLRSLRRTRNAGFTVADDALPLDEVVAAGRARRLADVVLPIRTALAWLPVREVDHEVAVRVSNGARLAPAGIQGPYRVESDGRLLAVYADGQERAQPELVLVQPSDLEPPQEPA